MKKTSFLFTLLPLLYSCSITDNHGIETPEDKLSEEYKTVTMTIPPLEFDDEDLDTKISVELSTLTYIWEEQDVVGIFPDKGSQIYFSMADGVGTSKATFDGGGWALKKNSAYYSYFPFVADFYINKEEVPVNFEGQIQNGNGNSASASLGKYCYMFAKGTSDESTGNLEFKYDRVQSLFMIDIPVEAGNYESLDIIAGEPVIALRGTMNVLTLDKTISNAVYDDHLTIGLQNVTFDSDGTLTIIAITSPFDINEKQLTLNLHKDDGTIATSSAFGRTYNPGKGYKIKPNISVSPTNIAIPGEGETVEVKITAAGSSTYSVSTDVDWLTLSSNPTSGSAVINITAGKGTTKERLGHVIISEDVTYKETTITLYNKVKITQDINGMSVGVGDWEDGDNIIGSI